jgi:hypothetical protein
MGTRWKTFTSRQVDCPVDLAAEEDSMWITLYLVGVVLVALLTGLVWWDSRRRRARPPGREEQPQRPGRGTHVEEPREAADFGKECERFTPHGLPGYGNMGSRPVRKGRPTHHDDEGGAFGSGGLGG